MSGVPAGSSPAIHSTSGRAAGQVSVSNGARLLTTTGIDPQCLSKSDGADFEISVLAEGVSQAVYHRVAAVPATAEQSIWSPVKIDLSQYAGKQIRITFSTGPGPANIYDCDWTEWIDPVIVGN